MAERTLPILLAASVLGACQTGSGSAEPDRWRLVEEWRLGTAEDGPAAFGQIRAILVDRRAQVWVLDSKVQEIRIFDSAGGFVRTVGRRGSGPGEFVGATGMAQGADGTIWVADPNSMRITGFDEDGRFVAQALAPNQGYGYLWEGAADSAGRLWDPFRTIDSAGPEVRLRYRRFTPGMARADTVDLAACQPPPGRPTPPVIRGHGGGAQIPFQPTALTAIDFNGQLACIPWSAEYSGVIVDLIGGDTLVRFRHAAPMIPVRPAERDSEVAHLTTFSKRIGAEFSPSMVPTEQPAIVRLYFDDRGRLWVRRITERGWTEFDQFNREGRLEATITTSISPAYPAPVFRGDRVYFVVDGPDDVPQVARLRIDRTPVPR